MRDAGGEGRRVLIFYQRNWGILFGQYLCERLAATWPGSRFAALVIRNTALAHLLAQDRVPFERYWYWDDYLNDPDRFLDGDATTLGEICREVGVDSIWPLVQSLRTLVKDYRRKYYYAFTQSVSDAEIVKVVRVTYRLVRQMLDEFDPEVIILPNAVSLPHLLTIALAKKRGIFVRWPTDSKVSGRNIWVEDGDLAGGLLHRRMAAVTDADLSGLAHLAEARAYLEKFRREFIKPEDFLRTVVPGRSWWGLVDPRYYLKMGELALRRRFYRKHRAKRGQVVTIDNAPPWVRIRDRWASYRYQRHAMTRVYDPVPERFLFFPLQVQPEQSTDVVAPFFNNQLEAARLTAMALPDDLTLVVKDHPAMADKRTPGYLFKLQHQANVKLVDYRTPAEELLRRSVGVVSLSGTALMEAVFLNKPAIQLGNMALSLLFPQVRRCTDFTLLGGVIREHILGFEPQRPENELRTLAYIALVWEEGFALNYGSMWEHGEAGDRGPMWEALLRELNAWFGPGEGVPVGHPGVAGGGRAF
ncbi:MAG: hypothetical protein HQL57_02910 [Magnetococcales bacterium]|nr:hypothetical protein [Magnetococcales bacterium]MBF0156119.1 hypothetical protein [Magnetococcales bacterium]